MIRLCACGCGKAIKPKKWHKYSLSAYLSGHNKPNSKENKEDKRKLSI